MNKPNDFDQVHEFGESAPLPPGGYICRIMGVKETKSKAGNDMLEISLDIAEGEFKDYYANKYRASTKADKKWDGVVRQLVYDPTNPNATNRGFKTFITCAEKSNPNFVTQWGNGFCECFKGKLVGGAFRREQFPGDDGKLHFTTKCFMFHSVDRIREGIPVPEDKLYDGSAPQQNAAVSQQTYRPQAAPAPQQGSIDLSDFVEVSGTPGDLPF